jgi:hypothetical protein
VVSVGVEPNATSLRATSEAVLGVGPWLLPRNFSQHRHTYNETRCLTTLDRVPCVVHGQGLVPGQRCSGAVQRGHRRTGQRGLGLGPFKRLATRQGKWLQMRWRRRLTRTSSHAATCSCRRADDCRLLSRGVYRFPRPNMRPNRLAIDLAGLMSIRVDPSGSGRLAACSAESVVRT